MVQYPALRGLKRWDRRPNLTRSATAFLNTKMGVGHAGCHLALIAQAFKLRNAQIQRCCQLFWLGKGGQLITDAAALAIGHVPFIRAVVIRPVDMATQIDDML